MSNPEHDPDCLCCRVGPEAALQHERELRARFPHIVIGVADNPPFAYSVGLWNNNLPELIVQGMTGRQAMQTINLVAAWMEHENIVPEDGSIHDDPFTLPTKFIRVSERVIDDMMRKTSQAERAISRYPYALQIVWPDREGRFPDDPHYAAEFRGRQQILA